MNNEKTDFKKIENLQKLITIVYEKKIAEMVLRIRVWVE